MAITWFLFLSFVTSTLLITSHHSAAEDDRKVYIVYMGDTPKGDDVSVSSLHKNILQQVVGSDMAPRCLVHSYKRSINGFVARLTEEEAQEMSGVDGVVSVFQNQKHKMHTTRSWDFIGFSQKAKRSRVESDIIIGIFDIGIWPESDSFDDKGFGPPPAKWKGTCHASNFTCNNKIIGAKYYRLDGNFSSNDIISPRDTSGHGTHTASIAAGGVVHKASLFGLASGTARGGVPSARLAVYKVCWMDDTCHDADVLAAFDDAIADGVDILSLSIGYPADDYFRNSIAIGAFHAVRKGILTSVAAGNAGPYLETVVNFAPWTLSVAASTIDREFSSKVQLGSGQIYEGISVNTFDLKNGTFPIIFGGDAPNRTAGFQGSSSRRCLPDSLDTSLVKGKIVLCDGIATVRESLTPAAVALYAGAAGVILQGRRRVAGDDIPDVPSPLPASYLSMEDGSKVYTYINSTRNPIASISRSEQRTKRLAPYVAGFSSRGPNPFNPNILKPDLTAPGSETLSAWPPTAPVSFVQGDDRVAAYNIISGTSMSCPHASGAAAYVKSFNPTWSPAAIKSALMTTATTMSPDLNPEAEFAYGAGQINPAKAAYPGLVYDVDEIEYLYFLCEQGYSNKIVKIIAGGNSSCPTKKGIDGTAYDLNYPAFVLSASPSESINHIFHRTVTNVGSPTSTYKAKVIAPKGLKITVNPSVLTFKSLGEKLSYAVTVQGIIDHKFMISASLVWDDGTFQVRSPIVVYVPS
ncbi:hypothetical protein UlMin_025548 [Ulmus minor]